MRVITNEGFVSRRARIGKIGTMGGMLALLAGFITSLNFELIVLSYAFLIIGLFAFNIGRYNALRWGQRPRPYEVIAEALKGLDHKYVLVNYSQTLPGENILISPLGVFFIEVRVQEGEIQCEGSKWHRKRSVVTFMRSLTEGALGNPTKDAVAGLQALRKFVVDRLGEEAGESVPLEAVIVFTTARAHVSASEPLVPVLPPNELKAHVRTPRGRTKMTSDTYKKLLDQFAVPRYGITASRPDLGSPVLPSSSGRGRG
ncbi:MAG: NERD domain-containing protein [Chloroflexi bacterium]|nr:NERD domain-containing protein [Chloroflexota bacterium]